MKHFLLSTLLFAFSYLSFGQCPTTPIVLSSQADVDNFTNNYPGCTELQDALTINGADITDLTPLSNINSVYHLFIQNNSILDNLNGLNIDFPVSEYNALSISDNSLLNDISALSSIVNGFDSFDDVSIINNPMLTNLNGLESINYLFELLIDNNDSLINLSGLNNFIGSENIKILNNDGLTSFTGFEMVSSWSFLQISGNTLLQNLQGLNPNNNSPGSLEISNNVSLNDLSIINNWTLFYGINDEYVVPVNITGNSSLSVCNIFSICSVLNSCSTGTHNCDNFIIENNAQGCSSRAQVAQSCGLVPSNDDCSGAIDIIVGETIEAYDDMATTSVETPSCNDNGVDRADVWFTFNSGDLDLVSVLVENSFLNVQLWEGTCGSLTQVPDGCSTGDLWGTPVTPNTDYYIQIWSCTTCRPSTTIGLFTVYIQHGALSTNEVDVATVELFPNPVKNSLNINSTQTINTIEVYNLLGQQMLITNPNTLTTEIDLTTLSQGMCLVKVKSLGSEQTFRVVKE